MTEPSTKPIMRVIVLPRKKGAQVSAGFLRADAEAQTMTVPNRRSPRRQRLALHLHKCGPRPVLEALIAVEAGQPLDEVLDDFGRLPPSIYRAVGADDLVPDPLFVIDGGRTAA